MILFICLIVFLASLIGGGWLIAHLLCEGYVMLPLVCFTLVVILASSSIISAEAELKKNNTDSVVEQTLTEECECVDEAGYNYCPYCGKEIE